MKFTIVDCIYNVRYLSQLFYGYKFLQLMQRSAEVFAVFNINVLFMVQVFTITIIIIALNFCVSLINFHCS